MTFESGSMDNETETFPGCVRCEKPLSAETPSGVCSDCLSRGGGDTQTTSTIAGMGPGACGTPVQLDIPNSAVEAVNEAANRYAMIGEYARGGMGRILLVHDCHLGRDVALKELLPGLDDESTPAAERHAHELSARFLREARITGQLEHPSITPVHELGRRTDGTLYYTMKLIRGKTLDKAIEEARSLEERLALLPHFIDLCNAVAYAHARGVIHRDIKPDNVMIGDFAETMLIDWGLAKVKERPGTRTADPLAETVLHLRTDQENDSARTRYGRAMGTPAYMPPEQAMGDLDVIDERSDVYSLGAVLYQLLTAQRPYTGNSAHEVLRKVVAQPPRPVQEVQKGINRELAEICRQAMARNPDCRIASARALARRVESASRDQVFLNPLRPYLTDLVPALKSMRGPQRHAVLGEAQERMWRNGRLALRVAILNWLFILFAAGIVTTIIAMHPLQALLQDYQVMEQEIGTLKGIIHHISAVGQFPESFFAPPERASDNYAENAGELQYFLLNVQLGTITLLLAGFALLTNAMRHMNNAIRAPFVREVVSELEAGDGDVAQALLKRAKDPIPDLIVGIGTILGGVIGLGCHLLLNVDWIYRILFLIGGLTVGVVASGFLRYLYVIHPWRSRTV